MQKILINCITMDAANLAPLHAKISYWNKQNFKITIIGSQLLKQRLNDEMQCSYFEYFEIGKGFQVTGNILFLLKGILNNLRGLILIRKLKDQFDIVYSISSVLDLLIIPYALKIIDKKIKWVTVFDNLVTIKEPGNRIHRLLAWLFFIISLSLIKKADRVCAISEELRDYILAVGFKNAKLVLTGNAVESELIFQAETSKHFAYDALFAGRINEAKGIYDMIEVLKIILPQHRHFTLAILGQGDPDTLSKFKQYISHSGVEKNVIFLGQKTGLEKFNIFKKSKCFWFLSGNESFGVALLEAVCCGLPAFAYNLPPYEKLYQNGEVVISPKGDIRDVAKNVLSVFKSGKFENVEGARLLKKYSWESIAEIEMRYL